MIPILILFNLDLSLSRLNLLGCLSSLYWWKHLHKHVWICSHFLENRKHFLHLIRIVWLKVGLWHGETVGHKLVLIINIDTLRIIWAIKVISHLTVCFSYFSINYKHLKWIWKLITFLCFHQEEKIKIWSMVHS